MRNEEPQGPPAPEPPPREFRLKPAAPEFERVNSPVDQSTPGKAPLNALQINRAAASPPPARQGATSAPPENDVHAILRENLAREQARGLHDVIPQAKRMSRRKRDYWLLLIGVNLLVIVTVIGLDKNPVTLVFGFSAMVFCTIALTWVMWFVMDDY